MEESNRANLGRAMHPRGLSGMLAAVVMVVVILVVGGAGYFALNGSGGSSSTAPTTQSTKNCAPTTNPICTASNAIHDVTLAVPFKSVQQGNPVPFTATLPAGESASAYNFSYGDGGNSGSTSNSQVTHSYTYPGTYIASVTATVGTAVHDNYHSLVVVTVLGSFASSNSGNVPTVSGSIVANSSTTSNPTAVIQENQFVSFAGTYTGAPTNPLYTAQMPKIAWPTTGVTLVSNSSSASAAAAEITFTAAGSYTVTFVGWALGPLGAVAYQNYTWSVFVAATGSTAGILGSTALTSPHPGSLDVYELAPGGSNSEDPAIDYETVGYEIIVNVYQQLIAYNGSETGPTAASYVPVLATCVPGSVTGANNCESMYGSTLVSGDNYTFAISKNAQFYDPNTQKSWSVWPTDVVFSIARTMAFSTNPGVGANNGWILTQSLLPSGNGSWSTLHSPFNNTPANIMNAMTINESGVCTSALLANSNGCVTFHVNGAGETWPYFLELIADPLGGSIVPCGWFSASAQGAGIPDWTAGNSTGAGDHPCGAMGSSGWGSDPNSISPLAWDSWELSASAPPFVGNVQYHMVGSGPYALKSLLPATSYTLEANPSYAANQYCSWTGCWPAPNTYVPLVSVTWETSQVPGEQAYESGTADFASIPSTDTSFLLQLLAQGKVLATSFPSISIYFFPYNLYFDKSQTSQYTTNPITVQSDFFSNVGIRQFFTHSYPYNTVEQTINTKDGIQYDFNYGGAIPQFMANYYPTNVSFPTGDPSSSATTNGTAAWWWAQLTNSGSIYYDANVTNDCTVANPCQLPFFGETGAPGLDEATALWAAEISQLSGGRIKMAVVDINFITLVINSAYSGPYNNPMPFFTLGWAPDYPDPTDYVAPLYLPDNTYTAGDAVAEQFQNPALNAGSCHADTSMADFFYWANVASATNGAGGIANDCQGAAYDAMLVGLANASVLAAGPQRVLIYDLAEQIANGLALYTYWGQENTIVSSAAWINPDSYNANVTIGGGGDSTWFTITGNGIL
jgi:ABC-type transport system substrate-binding protein